MRQEEINRAEWQNPENWWGGLLGVYYSKRDTRVWVPKRTPALGWTLNFAHPAAVCWLVGFIALPAALARVLARRP